MKKSKNGILITLSSIPIIMVLGNSMLIPVLPKVASTLHLTSFQVSLLITLFSIPAAIVIPLAGIVSDRLGRKKVIITGLILYGIGGLMAGFTPLLDSPYPFLLASRIIQGIGAAGTAPIAMVLVGDLFESTERSQALGTIESSNAMGKVVSPIFGSLLGLITWYAMFFVFPFLIIPIIIAVWKLIKEPASNKENQSLSAYMKHTKKTFNKQWKWLIAAFFCGLITMFTTFGILFYLSTFLEELLKINGLTKGFILAIPLLGLCLTAFLIGTYLKKKSSKAKRSILIGLALLTLSATCIPWVEHPIILISLVLISGIGSGFVLPCLNLLVTSSIGVQERGIITSLYGSVRFFGVALGPPIFGILSTKPYFLFLGTSSLLALAFLLSLICIHRPQKLKGRNHHFSKIIIRKDHLHSI